MPPIPDFGALEAAPLRPAVTLPGLEHPAFPEVLVAAMPGVSLGDNDTPRLFPLADREKVNSWRAAIDLAPIDQHDLDSAWQPDELHRFESTGTTPGEGGDTR